MSRDVGLLGCWDDDCSRPHLRVFLRRTVSDSSSVHRYLTAPSKSAAVFQQLNRIHELVITRFHALSTTNHMHDLDLDQKR